MRKLWLVLDCNFLCWRVFHTMRGLSSEGLGTGVVYGFFKTLLTLEQEQASSNVVFCWDSTKKGVRHELLPEYKEKRHTKKLTEEQELAVRDLRRQMRLIRDEYLPYLGYKNIYFQNGYEADDTIASFIKNKHPKDNAVIVSADKDLYQLLGKRVCMWNPTTKKVTTSKTFREQYGVSPAKWSTIKAIAGCLTDQIPGVKGVKEKTAAKHLRGDLSTTSKVLPAIIEFINSGDYFRNIELVKLPFRGTIKCVPEEQSVDRKNWRRMCDRLNMKSIRDQCPGQMSGFGFLPSTIKRA